ESVADLGLRSESGPPFRCDAVVMFGITGDLAFKKLFPALYNLAKDKRLNLPVVGVGRSEWDRSQLLERARESISTQIDTIEEPALDDLAHALDYLSGDY